jgi:hypothetical protein
MPTKKRIAGRRKLTTAARIARARRWDVLDAANSAYKALIGGDHPGTPAEVAHLAFQYGEAWADEADRRFPQDD